MNRLAIFDCDGTLVDGQANVCEAMEEAFAVCGLPTPERPEIRRAVGLSLPQAMAQLLPDHDPDQHEMLANHYRDAFRAHRERGLVNEPLYDGITPLLRHLRNNGWVLAVATGKSDRGLSFCLAAHDIADLFDSLQTADRHPSKPHPSMIDRILDDTGIAADRAVMIGDTSFDMLMAGAGGIRGIGVAWGYHTPEELVAAGADAVANDMTHLRELMGAV